MKTETIHPAIFKIIDSCVTVDQLRCCLNLVSPYKSESIKERIRFYVKLRSYKMVGEILDLQTKLIIKKAGTFAPAFN